MAGRHVNNFQASGITRISRDYFVLPRVADGENFVCHSWNGKRRRCRFGRTRRPRGSEGGEGHGRRNEILIQDRGSERRRRKKFRYVPATLMPIGSFLSGRYTTAVFGLAPCLCNVASGVPSCTWFVCPDAAYTIRTRHDPSTIERNIERSSRLPHREARNLRSLRTPGPFN